MSKLAALVAIPLGLAVLKHLPKDVPTTITPFFPVTAAPVQKEKTLAEIWGWGDPLTAEQIKLQTENIFNIAPKITPKEGVVPFFPDTAVSAGKEFAEKKPFEFKPELLPKGPLPTEFKIDWTSRPTD